MKHVGWVPIDQYNRPVTKWMTPRIFKTQQVAREESPVGRIAKVFIDIPDEMTITTDSDS